MALSRGVSIDSVCGVIAIREEATWGKLGFSTMATARWHRTMRRSSITDVLGSTLNLYKYLDSRVVANLERVSHLVRLKVYRTLELKAELGGC
jgi:hypothetical protein